MVSMVLVIRKSVIPNKKIAEQIAEWTNIRKYGSIYGGGKKCVNQIVEAKHVLTSFFKMWQEANNLWFPAVPGLSVYSPTPCLANKTGVKSVLARYKFAWRHLKSISEFMKIHKNRNRILDEPIT